MEQAELLGCLHSLSHELRGGRNMQCSLKAGMEQIAVHQHHPLACTDVDVGSQVARVHISQLDPLVFATEYVAKNKPCIVSGERR